MTLRARLRDALDRVGSALVDRRLDQRTDAVRLAVGSLEARVARTGPPPASLREAEFSVFSQWGEDGIIQHLVRRLGPPEVFVEIGVGDYTESNTRFLLEHDNWTGLIVNGGTAHQEFVRRSGLGWRHSIDAVSAFVTAENVDDLLLRAGIKDQIGLLSIDVDGVDYWLLDAVSVVRPWIVVVETNSLWGPELAVTVPYDPSFVASSAHESWQYFGASLPAMHHRASAAGYRLVGVESHGINAFFVRDDVAGDLPARTPGEAYVRTRYRTVRDASRSLTYTGDDHAALLRTMRDLPLVDVRTGETRSIGELYAL